MNSLTTSYETYFNTDIYFLLQDQSSQLQDKYIQFLIKHSLFLQPLTQTILSITDKQKNIMEEYFNKSTIDFTKFSEAVDNPQRNKIYTYESEVSKNMKQKMQEFTNVQTKFYRNKIFHSAHKYQVPVYQYPKHHNRPNTTYHQFYRTHHKFTKPYGEHTKYIDNLNKNKNILRRCNFDLPINTLDVQSKTTFSKNNTTATQKYRRTLSRYEKHPVEPQSPKENAFDKTIQNQYLVFRKLYDKQRTNPKQKIQLDNSMNRILAAEMINLRINTCIPKNKSKTIES